MRGRDDEEELNHLKKHKEENSLKANKAEIPETLDLAEQSEREEETESDGESPQGR